MPLLSTLHLLVDIRGILLISIHGILLVVVRPLSRFNALDVLGDDSEAIRLGLVVQNCETDKVREVIAQEVCLDVGPVANRANTSMGRVIEATGSCYTYSLAHGDQSDLAGFFFTYHEALP